MGKIGIGIGVSRYLHKASVSWSTYWTTLISAVVDSDNPADIVLTFDVAGSGLTTSDFTVAGYTVDSLSYDATGKIITLTCTANVLATTVTFNKGTGLTTNVIVELARNSDSVLASGYYGISESALGAFYIHDSANRSFLNRNNLTKVRQNGNITAIKLFMANTDVVAECFFDVWRKDGATYDRVAHSDILALISNGTITITLPAPVAVIEGDFIGISGRNSDAGSVLGAVALTAGSYYVDLHSYPGPDDYNWAGAISFNFYIPIQSYMQAPLIVGIGDSLMAGHNINFSNIENSITVDLDGHIMARMYILNSKYVFQNMGIGSNSATLMAARFTADAINLKPRIVVIGGFAAGLILGETKATMLAKAIEMIDACIAADIVPVVCKITPSTDRTNGEMQTRDDTMADLQAIVATYPSAVWVDFDSAIGQFRAGGDAGNLWDIQAAYDDDGVHLNQAGYTAMAAVINTAILTKYTLA